MLVDGKWAGAWQPVQATDAKGGLADGDRGFASRIFAEGRGCDAGSIH